MRIRDLRSSFLDNSSTRMTQELTNFGLNFHQYTANMNITTQKTVFTIGDCRQEQESECKDLHFVCLLKSAEEINQINEWMKVRPSVVRFQLFLWIFYLKEIIMHESHGHQHTFLNLCRLLCDSHLPPLSFYTIHHIGTSLIKLTAVGKCPYCWKRFKQNLQYVFQNGPCEGKLNRSRKVYVSWFIN